VRIHNKPKVETFEMKIIPGYESKL